MHRGIIQLPDRTITVESLPFGKKTYPRPAKCRECGGHGVVNPFLLKTWDRVCAECRDVRRV